jgi:hypothetical protein
MDAQYRVAPTNKTKALQEHCSQSVLVQFSCRLVLVVNMAGTFTVPSQQFAHGNGRDARSAIRLHIHSARRFITPALLLQLERRNRTNEGRTKVTLPIHGD